MMMAVAALAVLEGILMTVLVAAFLIAKKNVLMGPPAYETTLICTMTANLSETEKPLTKNAFLAKH